MIIIIIWIHINEYNNIINNKIKENWSLIININDENDDINNEDE